MIVTANRLRSIGWLALLALCAGLVLVLSFRVNAVKSEVRKEENRIVALKREKSYLETEFETRANQQQLKAWNDLDFGYVAPTAGQYLESERQLAALGKPAGPDAPAPIRVASAGDTVAGQAAFPALANPLAAMVSKAKAAASNPKQSANPMDQVASTVPLGKRLTMLSSDDSAIAAKSGTRSVDRLGDEPVDKLVDKSGRAAVSKTSRTVEKDHGEGHR